MSETHPMDYYGRIRELEARVAELEAERAAAGERFSRACAAEVRSTLDRAEKAERERDELCEHTLSLERQVHDVRKMYESAERDAAARYDCKGGPGTTTPACGGCVTCLHRALELADFARKEAMAQMITMAREPERFDLVMHLHRQRAFSTHTFGPGPRTKGVVAHIRKELLEIESKPNDLEEWVDVVLLALDGAWRAGWLPDSIARAIEAKQTKNEGRAWPDWRTASPDAPIEHQRSAEESKP